VVELREHVDRKRPDPVEVEVHVVPRQVELLEVRPHGLGGEACVAQRRDGRACSTLRQLLPVFTNDEPVVHHVRRLRPEGSVECGVQLFVRPVVRPPDHVGDVEVGVVDDAREVEPRRAVVPPQHHAHEALRQARGACHLEMSGRSLALPHRAGVPFDPEPAQIVEDRLLAAGDVPRGVRVVDPQQQPVAEPPVGDGAQRVADVQRPGRARGEPDADHQSAAATSSNRSTYCREPRPGTRRAAAVQTTRKQVESTKPSTKPVTVGSPRRRWSARNVAVSWPPSAPPTVRMTVFIPLATPVWCSSTACTTMFPSAANARPIPTPRSAELTRKSYTWPCCTASSPNETAVTADPATRAGFEPKRAAIRPAADPTTNIPPVEGRRYSAEPRTEAPNPKPVLFGSCANCGKTTNDEYIPAPRRNAVRFAVQTARTRISAMSISGCVLRSSTRIEATHKAAPAAS